MQFRWGDAATLALVVIVLGGMAGMGLHANRSRVAGPPAEHAHGEPAPGPEAEMPGGLAGDEEAGLYLTPGGLYSAADIAANGRQTAAQRFKGFRAKHEFRTKPGDRLCPVTRTKANPACSWVIGGRQYEFCCPPCVDEFVKLAKEHPDEIKDPDDYVRR